ncbi:MAG: F0F1 ATP synthase subunit alpha [Candidatus Omnitrophica bacterium]|nr:F0F1 ATP synthase subunit alpha [Candidatus Omnitrophota bacterium]
MYDVISEPASLRISDVGRVREVKKSIAKVTGLPNIMNGQLVSFAGGVQGLIVGFTENDILALVMGDETKVRLGGEVYSVREEFRIPVGEGFIGRIINALGDTIDEKGPIASCVVRDASCENTQYAQRNTQYVYYPVFRDAPETMDRSELDSCFETGTKIIDAVIPIGKGQRQLIIGDRMTGKTTICVDAILNQKGKNVVCIYCCIGKSFSSLLKVAQLLKFNNALEYSIIVAATASTTVGEQYLAPYVASAHGEYFMRKGRDVLVVFDDMTKHAWSYRQLSLLLERPPGREAYPGDIYYIHSQLFERAGKLNKESGGGSMTFLPIVDTLQGDVTGYIPSNLISIADGQIYLNSALFFEGFKPAIDFSMSFSTVGGKAQSAILKELSMTVKLEYLQYRELLRLTKLKSGISAEAERKIRRGEAITALLSQDKNVPAAIEELIVLLYALSRGILEELDGVRISGFKRGIWAYIRQNYSGLAQRLRGAGKLSPELRSELDKAFVGYFKDRNQMPER